MQTGSVSIHYKIYNKGTELNESQLELLQSAESAALNAYVPYSKFKVGAAILLSDATILTGCNQENASYPCGICAERAVLYSYGNLKTKIGILKMAVSVKTNYEINQNPAAPCGLCRQVMTEFEIQNNKEIELIIGHTDRMTYILSSFHSLLPLQFHRGYLVE